MANETERRFLVRSDEWRKEAGPGVDYTQGYLSTDSKRNVRVRIGDNQARLTIKGQANGNTRPEFEYPIPLHDGEDIEHICLKPLLEKTRYTLKQDGLTWEIDEYAGENRGLIVAEVETTPDTSINEIPSWIGPEISGDERYRNSNLVEHPFSTWTQKPQKPDTKYYFTSGEKLPDGACRILKEQLNAAIDELSNPKGSMDVAVHEARKCVKRTRSLLRLLRPVIPKVYSRENRRLQAVGRKLSELRDAQALIETLMKLEEEQARGSSGTWEAKEHFRDAYAKLRARKEKITATLQDAGEIPTAVGELRETLKNINQVSLNEVKFSTVTDSLSRTVKRGKKASSNAYEDRKADNFHEFRKRVKDLRYQLELVSEMWPDVLGGYAESAKKLEQFLGDDHNLALLTETVSDKNSHHARSSDLERLIDAEQAKLRKKARQLSSRVYSEPTRAWTRRLESSWQAWKAENH